MGLQIFLYILSGKKNEVILYLFIYLGKFLESNAILVPFYNKVSLVNISYVL